MTWLRKLSARGLTFVSVVWKHVSEETIHNCFKKGGFSCVTKTTTVENIVAENQVT